MIVSPSGRALLALWLSIAVGCSKEKLSELADKATQAVSEQAGKVTESVKQGAGVATDAAKEQLALAGSFELALDTPVITSACYVNFIPQGSGRPNVLQLRSYREPAQEAFPSVMFQAQTTAAGFAELVGQTIPGQLFVQKTTDAPIWSSTTSSQIELTILSSDGKVVTAEFASGSLVSSQSGGEQPISGRITGVLP